MAELVAEGMGLLERDDRRRVESLLADGLRRAPAASELHLLEGMLRQLQGRYDDALRSFGRAIYCDATCSLAWFHRAAVLDAQGHHGRAAGDYATAARCLRRDDPHRWDAFLESMGHDALTRHCEQQSAVLR